MSLAMESDIESIALMKEAGGFEIVLPEQLVTNVIQNTKSKQQCPLQKDRVIKQEIYQMLVSR